MRLLLRLSPHSWVLVLLGSLGLLVWINQARIKRVAYVTGQASWSVDAPATDAGSPTGYAGGVRQMLVPERNSESQQWIMQTQQMLGRGEWRVRQVDYDNAPLGRETHLASLYRWWLGLVAEIFHRLAGCSRAIGVEQAALCADPLLQVLLLVGTTRFLTRRFGAFSAAAFALGLVALFPLGGGFLPGAPDHRNLTNLCIVGSILPLLAGLRGFLPPVESPARSGPGNPRTGPAASRWFVIAGVAGGLGLWLSPPEQLPILGGIGGGALAAAWIARGDKAANEFAAKQADLWRLWSLGGGVTVLAAYMIEYYPRHTDFHLETIHPLTGLGWIGAGELLAQLAAWIQRGKIQLGWRTWVVALLPAPFIAGAERGFAALAADPFASRLTNLPNSPVAQNLARWILQDGASPVVLATVLPLLLALAAGGFLFSRQTGGVARASLAVALGPAVIALGMACLHLRWWNTLDGLLLVIVVSATSDRGTVSNWVKWGLWPALLTLAVIPGLSRLWPIKEIGPSAELGEAEVQSLIDRDLAQWLTKRSVEKSAIVFASPELSAALSYYGSLRGIGTLSPENPQGVEAAVRIASATSFEEAGALVRQRGISYVVIPTWDTFLDEYARMGSGMPDRTFIARLHQWNLPPWLRPIVYFLPKIAGYEGQAVVVFEVVEEQNEAEALSQLAEYFVETGRMELADSAGEKLRKYPADLGALAALAQVELARGDRDGFTATLTKLVTQATRGADRALAWDRRLSVAAVLAQGKRAELAREQIRQCLAQADAPRLRSLSTNALVRLLALKKAFGQEFPQPRLQELARELIPPSLRQPL